MEKIRQGIFLRTNYFVITRIFVLFSFSSMVFITIRKDNRKNQFHEYNWFKYGEPRTTEINIFSVGRVKVRCKSDIIGKLLELNQSVIFAKIFFLIIVILRSTKWRVVYWKGQGSLFYQMRFCRPNVWHIIYYIVRV